jgi:HK97 family phage major capsid protein
MNEEIKRLRREADQALAKARKINTDANERGERLTNSEQNQVNGFLDEHDSLMTQAQTQERLLGIDSNSRLLAQTHQDEQDEEVATVPQERSAHREEDSDPTPREFDPYSSGWDQTRASSQFRDMSIREERTYLSEGLTREYNDAFWTYTRQGAGALDNNHLRSLNRLMTRGMVEGTAADGGFLAPTQMVQGILYETQQLEELKPRTEVIRSNARSLTYTKGLDNIVFGWVAELGTKPEDQLSFSQVTLTPGVGAVVVWVTDELLEDESYGLQGYLAAKVAEGKTLLEEEAIVSGSGSGRPFGILTRLNAEGGTPNRISWSLAGTGDASTASNVVSMPYNMAPRYRRNAAWILGTNAIRAVRLLRDTTNNYLWQNSLQAGQPATLNGYPVIESSATALNGTFTAGNDVGIFGDLSRYRTFERLGLQMKRLEELRALTDEVGFRFRFRTGGDVMYNPAFRTIRVVA